MSRKIDCPVIEWSTCRRFVFAALAACSALMLLTHVHETIGDDVSRTTSDRNLALADPAPPKVLPPGTPSDVPQGIYYDIVYVRAPRYGDERNTQWPEVKDPIQMEPGADLMLLHTDGSEEVLVPGGDGSIVDPFVSFDGQSVYYAKFHDQRREALSGQRRSASRAGSDIFKIHLKTREIVRLTHQEFTPNTGAANWSADPVRASDSSQTYLGYGIYNLGPCPLPGGKIIFTSSRNGFLPNKGYTFPNLQLFVMDDDGRNVEQIGHLNLGSALHPTILADGRVMFASYEAQGLRDQRLWGLWAIYPDGRRWEPLVSAFAAASVFHFQTQLSDGRIVVEEYYNQNNNGFGTFVALPPWPTTDGAPFGDPAPRHASNPPLKQGIFSNGKPRMVSYAFSPVGFESLTAFTIAQDSASPKDADGVHEGKVTHPAAAPHNDLLLVWSPGPANNLTRPANKPVYDGGLYLLRGGKTAESHKDLVLIKNDPQYNEMQPRPVVPYKHIYGLDQPFQLTWLPNDGGAHEQLPSGTPFGLVGTSSFYKRNTSPGIGVSNFDGLDPLNTSQNGASTNWDLQGGDAGKYTNDDIYAVRVLAMEPTSHLSYGPLAGRNFVNHANERLRILGEIPLRKFDAAGNPILDPDGNPDTSFLAKIPADVPFTFQTLDKNGLVLNMSQTWHQVRPGEARYDCGGCHAHAQVGTDFHLTYAARPEYKLSDLSRVTPLLHKDAVGDTVVSEHSESAIDVEYYRDIKPLLTRSCVKCHSKSGNAKAGLVLDDDELIGGYENTYHRLANDQRAQYGRQPMIKNGQWRQSNASRYVRMFQSRRSLLAWKVFGARLDGWANDDHPTESVPGDTSTFPAGVDPNRGDIDFVGTIMPPPDSGLPPLSDDEKMLIARWIDLGCPINSNQPARKDHGWFLDDLRPTLTVASPRAEQSATPLTVIRIGAFDYYSGLDPASLSVKANFAIDGHAPGSELASLFKLAGDSVWTLAVKQPITRLSDAVVSVSVRDKQGNVTKIERSFSIVEKAAR
jgi:hypothetical protein